MKKTDERKMYNCPRYNNQVALIITYLHHDTDHKVASGFECDSDRKCDIGRADDRGGYTWNRDLCPANEEIKKMNQ